VYNPICVVEFLTEFLDSKFMDTSTHPRTRFKNIWIQGFRRLKDVQFPLRPLCVMIGANGTGKTSVLDIISLLANSAQGKLSSSITDFSGLPNVLTYDGTDDLRLRIAMEVLHHEPLEYSLRLKPQGVAYVIADETLSQKRMPNMPPFTHIDSRGPDVKYFQVDQSRLVRPNWEHNPLETSLSQVPKMFREPEDFRNRLSSSTFYHVLNVDPRSPVRLPQPMQPATLPGKNGEELVSCLFYLRETQRERFDAIEDSIRTAFPRFERLDFPPVAAGTLGLAWREHGFAKPLYMHQLSEGTLRFLWLTTLLQSPGLTALTLLDEPEVSLHPELLSLLADLLREASHRSQLIVATHSDRLIRFLEPKEVLLMNSTEDGMTSVTWGDELDLAKWLEEYSLDELWRNGRIGART
jgi:predicted ATPase